MRPPFSALPGVELVTTMGCHVRRPSGELGIGGPRRPGRCGIFRGDDPDSGKNPGSETPPGGGRIAIGVAYTMPGASEPSEAPGIFVVWSGGPARPGQAGPPALCAVESGFLKIQPFPPRVRVGPGGRPAARPSFTRPGAAGQRTRPHSTKPQKPPPDMGNRHAGAKAPQRDGSVRTKRRSRSRPER